MPAYNLSLATLAAISAYCLAKVTSWIVRRLTSPLRYLPGPPSSSFIFGNVLQLRSAKAYLNDGLIQNYGKVMKCKAFFGEDRLLTTDTKALNHILMHSLDYQKPAESRFILSRLLGNGILVTEEEKHKQQRRIMNPSFSQSSISDLTPTFFQKTLQLRDIWVEKLTSEQKDAAQKFDVLDWLSRTTLDIIGLAGFHHMFEALDEHQEPDALSKALGTFLRNGSGPNLLVLLQASFPLFRIIPTKNNKRLLNARSTMHKIGQQLLSARREGELREKGKDLLSVLVRANTDTDLPSDQRLNDEDVLAQVPTFLIAGHETTSNQTAWALFALSQRPELQSRLRTELLSVPSDTPSMDELGSLTYLDAVVRETMRLYAAVSSIVRVAMKDDVIPVAEPYVDQKGNICYSIQIKKGEGVIIPITAVNRAKDIWGEDAGEFNPDRWASPPEAARAIPGTWSDLMTFSGGSHSCIGFRFAIIEMKALLFTLLRTFEFSLAVPADAIELRSPAILRPFVRDEKGAQMPLMLKLYEDST